MNEASEQTKFDHAIEEIIAGAKKLKTLTESDEEQSYHDIDDPFTKVSSGAFCLKLAYKIWSDLQIQESWQKGSPVGERKTKMKATVQETLPANLISWTPDQVDEFAKAFRQYHEARQKGVGSENFPDGGDGSGYNPGCLDS